MGHMGQVGHFKMTHLYHPPFHMAHPSRGTPLDAYFVSRIASDSLSLSLKHLEPLAGAQNRGSPKSS